MNKKRNCIQIIRSNISCSWSNTVCAYLWQIFGVWMSGSLYWKNIYFFLLNKRCAHLIVCFNLLCKQTFEWVETAEHWVKHFVVFCVCREFNNCSIYRISRFTHKLAMQLSTSSSVSLFTYFSFALCKRKNLFLGFEIDGREMCLCKSWYTITLLPKVGAFFCKAKQKSNRKRAKQNKIMFKKILNAPIIMDKINNKRENCRNWNEIDENYWIEMMMPLTRI